MSGSSPPWSPLVQQTSQPTDPSSIQRAAVAAGPKSASSGWPAISMNRAGRQVCASAEGRGASVPPVIGGSPRLSHAPRDSPSPRLSSPYNGPEASLVSPHERSLARAPAPVVRRSAGGGGALLLEGGKDLRGVAFRLDLGPHPRDAPGGIDEEGR